MLSLVVHSVKLLTSGSFQRAAAICYAADDWPLSVAAVAHPMKADRQRPV
jgi:hypothetical protein